MTDIVVARGMSASGDEITSRKKRALPGTFTTLTCQEAASARSAVAFTVSGVSDSSVTCTVYSRVGFITLSATSTLYYNTTVISEYLKPAADGANPVTSCDTNAVEPLGVLKLAPIIGNDRSFRWPIINTDTLHYVILFIA